MNVLSPKSIADVIQRTTSAISLFVDNIAAVSLLVVSVGIITTLWTLMERIREIGILKAIGLIFGVGLAFVLRSFLTHEFAFINPIFTPQSFISTWVLCLGLSMVSGFYPAWRVSRLDPVASLRYE